jgi:outer membrane protein OmpA-like peptidoglycan-associated protein
MNKPWMTNIRRITIGVLAALCWWSAPAAAQSGAAQSGSVQSLASETFEAQAVESTSIWSTATTDVAPHLSPTAALVVHYADDPVELRRKNSDASVARLVDNQLKADLGLGVGLYERVELGVVLPVVLHQSGEASAALPAPHATDFGELRAHGRARLVRHEGFGLGAQLTAYLPTSSDAPYQSSSAASGLGSLIADYQSDGVTPWHLAANLGWALRPAETGTLLSSDDRLDARIGAEVAVMPNELHLLAGAFGRWEVLADTAAAFSGEYQGGARVFWGTSGLASTVGVGGGLGGGYGTPDLRIIASLSYAPSRSIGDPDTIVATGDRCSSSAEDVDGYQDADGCPDPDNDGDGVLDVDDACPNQPEDLDGFDDSDGCPDRDNDGDGVLDFSDACPDVQGEQDFTGCPFIDEDDDGIDASVDQCPDQAEDIDTFEDNDGCPDRDNDRDGIADIDDACPDVAESINGVTDEDGCPDEGNSAVRLSGDRIEILERVYFDTNRATIKSRSHSVLEQVASVMKAQPDIRLLRVQGHTDARGADDLNLNLSQRRATAVKEFLIERDVPAQRLSARGYGESHPIAENTTPDGRAQNRRVEFHIIERGPSPNSRSTGQPSVDKPATGDRR